MSLPVLQELDEEIVTSIGGNDVRISGKCSRLSGGRS